MTPYLQDADFTLYQGDALDVLRGLPDESVHCVVTSPPYWGLRDYGTEGQLGLEPTPDQYVANMVALFREVRRVLRRDGTCWLNLGDSYAQGHGGSSTEGKGVTIHKANRDPAKPRAREDVDVAPWSNRDHTPRNVIPGLKPKDLCGIPWRVAFALQADGWYLRSDIIWSKPNPMPESVTDRPTKAHEYLFLLTRSPRYFYDADAIREPAEWARWGDQTNGKHEGQQTGAGWIGSASKDELQRRKTKTKKPDGWDTGSGGHGTIHREGREKGAENYVDAKGRNARSVWEIATQPYPEAHFATFPEELARRCIAAGTSERGCCPECGAPWEREVESSITPTQRVHNGAYDPSSGFGKSGWLPGQKNVMTLGWRPSCEHSQPPVPCVVLDPFMGSGTVAHVARKLGRRSIGVELSPEYCELAARRLQQQSLLA